jgi:hypothetical protein
MLAARDEHDVAAGFEESRSERGADGPGTVEDVSHVVNG